ncbi:MAG: DUF3365 domain-containing protein [Niabella sp.]
MKMFLQIGVICPLIFLFSCGNNSSQTEAQEGQKYLQIGDSISMSAQTALLENVSAAIKTYGIAGAVDFCNERALPLTDSFLGNPVKTIQRLSDRNRNPVNAIQSSEDSAAWQELKILMQDSSAKKQLIVRQDNGDVLYYKAITIVMPTCLSCHGSKDSDISSKIWQAIADKHPLDKATDYQMGELRGMWKILLNKNLNDLK